MNRPRASTEYGVITSMLIDCIDEPVLVLNIQHVDNVGESTTHRVRFNDLRTLKRIPGIGDKVSMTKFTGTFEASLEPAIVNLTDESPGGYGATAMVWIWLGALELSLRRKLRETVAMGVVNKQTELWTRELGALLDWQLGKGLTSYFGRLEPGDVGCVDQLYYAEKTTIHHRGWNRQGETKELQDRKIDDTGVYFITRNNLCWPLLVKC